MEDENHSLKGVNILKFDFYGNLVDQIHINDDNADKENIYVNGNYLFCVYTKNPGNLLSKIKFIKIDLQNYKQNKVIIKTGNVQGSVVKTDKNDNIYVAFEQDRNKITIMKSTNGDRGFPFASSFNINSITTHPYEGISELNNTRANSFPSMDIDKSNLHPNRIYIAYAENLGDANNYHIVVRLRYSDDGGASWSSAKTISSSDLSQAWMPWLSVDPVTGMVAVIYQGYTDSYENTNVYVAYSTDGDNFVNTKVSDNSFYWQPIVAPYAGDYIGVAVVNKTIFPAWADPHSGHWQAYLSELTFNANISGPDLICSQGTYKVSSNFEHIQSFSWETDNNLELVSTNGNQATVNVVNEIREGNLYAKLYAPWGEVGKIEKTIWLGKPGQPVTNPPGYPTVQMALGEIRSIRVTSAPGYPYQYIWNITGSIEKISGSGARVTVEAVRLGWGSYKVKTRNQCGYSVNGGGSVKVSSGGGGWLAVYPNPTSSQVTVQLKDYDNSKATMLLYDTQNNLRMKRELTYSKTEIDLSSLPSGNYILKVIKPDKAKSVNIIKF